VAHRPDDLEWLEADTARVITYDMYRNGRLRFTMTLNASQLRAAIGNYVDGKSWHRMGTTTRLRASFMVFEPKFSYLSGHPIFRM
jgi:hypothetical protein